MTAVHDLKNGRASFYEPAMLVHELIEALEQMPFDALVKLRVKNGPDAHEHLSLDSDHALVLTGLVNQVFLNPEDSSHVVLDAWPRAVEHRRPREPLALPSDVTAIVERVERAERAEVTR